MNQENKQKLQQLFQELGSGLHADLPTTWCKAVVGYFLVDQEAIPQLQVHILLAGQEDFQNLIAIAWDEPRADDAVGRIQKTCERIHQLCQESQDAWTSMSIAIHAGGSFRVDWDYAPIARYDSHFILDWQSRYLE